ncbi:hypothetical protein [Deinococcus sp. Leaf326]|uniref:hypothetical protein n=1 Tax=Deinococcus sp. Leaf326 TaxID=1736338 RepID=UPI000AE19547|nr:hypothetical protein [Deinococcus sp. Leaf326]
MTGEEERLSVPTGYSSSTDIIVSFTQAEAWAVGAGVLCLALTAFLRRPEWVRWALLAPGLALTVRALR